MREDLTFLHGGRNPQCVATVDKHFDYHVLQLMTAGAVELFYDDQRYEMHGRWFWPCHPGPYTYFHEWPQGEPWNHRYIACTGPLAMDWQVHGLWPETPQTVADEELPQLVETFDRMLDCALQPGRFARLRAINLLEAVLLRLAELRQSAEDGRPQWLNQAVSELAKTRREPDYERLAAKLSMSLTTFRRRFREATGQSPHAFHLDCRICEARRLLGETDDPLKHIAAQLGYGDVYYFSRQFAQHVGVPPGAYRRSRQV